MRIRSRRSATTVTIREQGATIPEKIWLVCYDIDMMQRSLRAQLGAIFVGFLLLVVGSATVTFWLVQIQQLDATVINLAGRQRMLAQQMARLALTETDGAELSTVIAQFEQTHTLLAGGAKGQGLIPRLATNATIEARLRDSAAAWETFRRTLQRTGDQENLDRRLSALLVELDGVVAAYEEQAQTNIARLRLVQIVFLLSAFALLTAGYILVRRRLIEPLAVLDRAAQTIGAGSLDRPIPALRGSEFGKLARTMEAMRLEMASHQRLLAQQVAQRTKELTQVFEFSQEIVQQLEPEQLMQSVTDRSRDLMQGEAASLCMMCEDGRYLELVASSGVEASHLGLRQSTKQNIASCVIEHGETVVMEGSCAHCRFLHQFGDASCIAGPLQVGDRVSGSMCVVRPQRPFDEDETQVFSLMANAAAIALENSRLIEARKQQARENAALAERERLAAELHDNLAQTLGAMHLSVDQLAHNLDAGENEPAQSRLATLQASLKQAYAQVRLALTGLQEALPDDGAFMADVHSLLAEFEEQSGVHVRVEVDNLERVGLTSVTQKQALHILREALTNVRRHACAKQVDLIISRNNGTLMLLIADDGCGFDPAQVNTRDHLGLTIMRTRAERSRGRLDVNSAPGQGTQIRAMFPVETDADQTEGRV